jgi:hypothetical protein
MLFKFTKHPNIALYKFIVRNYSRAICGRGNRGGDWGGINASCNIQYMLLKCAKRFDKPTFGYLDEIWAQFGLVRNFGWLLVHFDGQGHQITNLVTIILVGKLNFGLVTRWQSWVQNQTGPKVLG